MRGSTQRTPTYCRWTPEHRSELAVINQSSVASSTLWGCGWCWETTGMHSPGLSLTETYWVKHRASWIIDPSIWRYLNPVTWPKVLSAFVWSPHAAWQSSGNNKQQNNEWFKVLRKEDNTECECSGLKSWHKVCHVNSQMRSSISAAVKGLGQLLI